MAAHQAPPRPWDSPGKSTGVGCYFLLQCMKVKREIEVAQLCLTLSYPMDCRLPDSSIHRVFHARVLEWGAIAFSPCSLRDSQESSLTPQFKSINSSNEYSGLFPLGWIGWISLQSKGLSRVFSNTTVQKPQFFYPQPSLWSNSHIHTCLVETPQL